MSPAPNATSRTVSPSLMDFVLLASSKAIAMAAAEVFPYFVQLMKVFSFGMPIRSVMASMILRFA